MTGAPGLFEIRPWNATGAPRAPDDDEHNHGSENYDDGSNKCNDYDNDDDHDDDGDEKNCH